METAIAYIRVSDSRQVIDGNSLATQERQVREYAQSRGYLLDRVFVEPGESAKTENRPVLQELLQFCVEQRGQVQTLIVPKIDRLARNAYDYTGLKLRLAKSDVRLESVGERLENNPVGRFTESILASVAQFDNEIRAERCRGGMVQAVMEGRWVWPAPLGFRNIRFNSKATIEPDPATAPAVVELFCRLAGGSQPREAREWLLQQGVKLGRSQFFRLIRNPAYIGTIEAFGQTNIAVPPFVPLVSRAVFRQAQAAIQPRLFPKTIRRDNPDFPLRGTLRCECGAFLTAGWAHGRSKRYAHYRCKSCHGVNLRREIVHAAFCDELRALEPNPEHLDRLCERILAHCRQDERSLERRRQRVVRQIESLSKLQKGIATKNALGVIPDDLAKEQIKEIEDELAELDLKQANLARPKDDLDEAILFAKGFLGNLADWWSAAGVVNQKRLQRFVFPNGLTVGRDGASRTAEKERLAGLSELLHARQSHVVGYSKLCAKPF